ncbi:MAG: WD40 repeat domain-containing serine/threonine-protein kinase [Cyanobacteria bacterium J06597_16]
MAYCLNPNCHTPQTPLAANFCQSCGTPLVLQASNACNVEANEGGQTNRYQLVSLLGQGGFGRTFLAERLSTNDDRAAAPCVIKQIYNNSLAGDSGFCAEAERLRKLGEHPQIPALLAAIENELGQFLVQAFVPGNNLEEQIEREGPWTETKVRSLLKALVPVLQYVHSFNIIHRDIKPANIVLAQNKNFLPMLVDFGAAKWVRQAPAKTVIGSAGYAAPEQSMGQATFASDIYSLGLTCLHALTGIHPFALQSAAENRWVWRDYLPNPIEPRFAQLLDQMVAMALPNRYETMDQVALDLQFSRNPLLHAPKQLLTRAKKSIEPLTNTLQPKRRALPARPVIAAQSHTWQRQQRLTQPIGLTQAIAISPVQHPSGAMFATAGTDGALRLWHQPSGQLIHTFPRRRIMGEGHTAGITALKFHPDGRALYSASADGTIKEWDCAEHCLLNTLASKGWNPTALDISPDGARLVSAYDDGQIALWDITTLKALAQLAQHQKRIRAIAISPSGTVLASASDDSTLKLWRWPHGQSPQLSKTINLGKQVYKHRSRQEVFGTPQWSPEQRAIALAFHAANQPTAQSTAQTNTQPTTQSAAASLQLITAISTGLVSCYPLDEQMNPGNPVTFYQSPSPITAFALSRDGILAIGSEDTVLTLWNVSTGECVAKLAHDWGLVAAAFSTNGQTLITASADEVISIWQRDPTQESINST